MDNGAYEQTVHEQKDRIYGYAVAMLHNPAEAQDVAQEALVRLWQHRGQVDGHGAPFWLRRTAHNLCIDRIRRRKTRPQVEPESFETLTPDDNPGPAQLAESGETGRQIGQALQKLSDQDRAIVVLREVQGLPYGEIAEMLEMPLGTLKARLHRARHRLRAVLVRRGVTP